MTKTTKKKHKLGKNGTKNISQANGSVQSIIDWAVKYKLDLKQRRVFEMIIGSFLLTFILHQMILENLLNTPTENHSTKTKNYTNWLKPKKENQNN